MTVTAHVLQLPHAVGLALPAYETEGSAGLDLRAAIPEGDEITLKPMGRALVPTGLTMSVPQGYEVQVRPRSGLALKFGITCLNSPGTVDSDYRGEVGVILVNLGSEDFVIRRGDRIAQMIVAQHARIVWETPDALETTARGEGGFGSTGR
ncbi:dUTP diphosphatase [Asticcacaulis benevestitus]|uniref:Deoxyuridine 5'-triphosphate nucleotidohydrolase n=1 Tax=Asticcacaulis benevestitus DSM 16100 = ATCC BAA-896 TaxID=1121022 RepID=V4PQ11_9CAUL|nr:dUTP diphosphatase [Asticcacaulis benevestitus]ESQ90386.1 deoxyuridine 5'-triphosphate nucleotidohydrolase [Asticcacaulis benevestitus DSM 16100 = ATCC BAA-896]